MSLISKQTAGIILIAGLGVILALNLIFIQPVSLSIVFIFGLIMSVLFLYRPLWGTLLFLFARPSIDKFSENYSLNIRENLSLNAAAVLGVLFITLSFIFILKNYRKISIIPLKFFWALFIILPFISIIYSTERIFSLYETLRILSIFCAFALAFLISREEKNRKNILYAVIFSSFIPFLFALYQMLTETGLGGTFGIESRLFGTFSHPNSFASFALIIAGLLVFYIFKNSRDFPRWAGYSLFFITIFIIFGTFSRGAWLAIIIFALILSLLKSPKIIFAVVAGIVLILVFSETARERTQDVYNPPATSSIRWRFEQWKKMYGLFKEKPLTGYGAGTETVIFENEFGFYAGNPYTHNDFLRAGVETGIFGMLAYALLMGGTIWALWKKYRTNKKIFTLIILALFISELGFAMSSNILRGTATQWTLWALVALAL